MTLPLITVVIPAHNAAKFLPDSIGSLRNQRDTALDIIVIDDGSTDNTSAVAESLGDDVRVIHTPKIGPGAARNRGIEASRGEFIALLDADDLFPPNSLTARAERLVSDASAAMVGGFIQMITLIGAESTAAHDPTRVRNVPYLNVNLGAFLYRRDLFERVGGFDESLFYSEDVDWHLRAQEADAPLVTLRCVTLHYRRHPTNVTQQAGANQIPHVTLSVLSRASERRGMHTNIDDLNRRFAESIEPPPKTPPPVVSVIVCVQPTHSAFLDDTVASVLEQTCWSQPDAPMLDLILIGVTSIEAANAAGAAGRYGARVVGSECHNVAACRNAALAAARGDLIAFIDTGDIWLRDKLRRQIDYLRANPHIDYISGYSDTNMATAAPPLWGIPLSSLVARRSVFDRIGSFDPAYPQAHAADWFTRALDANLARALPHEAILRSANGNSHSHIDVSALQREIARIHLASLKRRQHEMKYRQP